MRRIAPIFPCAVGGVVLLCMLLAATLAQGAPLAHVLTARLFPEEARLEVHDVLTLPADAPGVLELRVARQTLVREVRLAAESAPAGHAALPAHAVADPAGELLLVDNEDGRLRIRLPEDAGGKQLHLRLDCRFEEDVDEAPANMDNPGFGVEGVIHPKGAMLLAGSGWHPMSGHPEGDVFRIAIRAPRGMHAVTTGTLVSMQDEGEESVSTWETLPVLGPLPLAAGWWEVAEAAAGKVRVLTCFTKENAALAPRYLEASARWIAFYERLHGPYPFGQFLVVENFLPTGYGFPGFTLLGGAVLRLPFIPETSLRHEIAHCWWGNGVFVDYSQGNWCEGLATYVADYLGEEEKSADAAREYRLRTLRRYAQLAAGREDFPLARFASRMSPATQAVGYGKAMFVFHMIRMRLGDEAFWASLRAVYREWLFKEAGWEELRAAFVAHGGWDEAESRRFMQQWIARPGAPALALEQMRRERRDGGDPGWGVLGLLTQAEPAYFLPLRLRVDMGNAAVIRTVLLDATSKTLDLDAPATPRAVQADPDAHLFRLLTVQEIPATVDSLKGATSLTVVVAAELPAEGREALATLLAGLSQPQARLVEESSLQEADLHALQHRDLLFFGQPATAMGRQLLGDAPAMLPWDVGAEAPDWDLRFWVDDTAQDSRRGGLRGVVQLAPHATAPAVARAAFLLSHYGRYSVVAFRDGHNVLKETWTPGDGPATHRFKEE